MIVFIFLLLFFTLFFVIEPNIYTKTEAVGFSLSDGGCRWLSLELKTRLMDKQQDMFHFNDLPDTMILDIFQHFSLEELCLAKCVCRRWKQIAETTSLWRVLDVRHFTLTSQKMKAFLQTCIHSSLTTLKIRGFVDDSPSALCPLPDDFLQEIFTRAPTIQDFHLENYVVSESHIEQLIPSISHLSLESSGWDENWLQKASKMLPSLTYLNLSLNSWLLDSDLLAVSRFSSLKELDISSCRHFTDTGIKSLCRTLNQLEFLNISHTRCTDVSLAMISQSLPCLEKIDLSCCPLISLKCVLQMVKIKTSLKLIAIKHVYLKAENMNRSKIKSHEAKGAQDLVFVYLAGS